MGVLGGFTALGVLRLADYQLINAESLRARADARRVYNQTLYAKRGTIYDRNGNVITSSVECSNIALNTKIIEKPKKVVSALVDVLGLDKEYCSDLVDQDTTWVYVKRQVDQEDADKLSEMGLAGIEIEPAIKRVYPYGTLASQVIGAVNTDNVGLTGLEKYYDEVLTGTNGSLTRERGRDGSYIAGGAYRKVAAQDGTDLVLTLDVNIQRAAEDALAEAVESAAAEQGSVLVIDPATGDILAACSYPTYDPADLANATTADMNLRAVSDAYEPGSVFKTLVMSAALETGAVSMDTVFSVPAKVKVGDDMVGDSDLRDYQMDMDPREIIRRSSNAGMVLVGERLGADNLAAYIDTFRIGQSSGVDFLGEAGGIVRERADYDGASLGVMSFGQGISAAPIEIARAVGSIANGGIMTTPHFLKSKKGEELDWSGDDTRVISEDTAEKLTSMMKTVVEEGTGTGAQIEGVDVAGKTGTAERASETGGYMENNYVASFIGFAPADKPVAMAYVTLVGTPHLSYAAAKPFATIMSETLTVLGEL